MDLMEGSLLVFVVELPNILPKAGLLKEIGSDGLALGMTLSLVEMASISFDSRTTKKVMTRPIQVLKFSLMEPLSPPLMVIGKKVKNLLSWTFGSSWTSWTCWPNKNSTERIAGHV